MIARELNDITPSHNSNNEVQEGKTNRKSVHLLVRNILSWQRSIYENVFARNALKRQLLNQVIIEITNEVRRKERKGYSAILNAAITTENH